MRRIILERAKIIDVVRTKVLENHRIIIKEDKILSIDPDSYNKLEIQNYDEIINLSNKIILPGLINMHVHLTANEKEDLMNDMIQKTDEQLFLQGIKASYDALKSGITTVRDCGSRNNITNQIRNSIRAGKFIGPRIISCGMPITSIKGHCYYMGLEVNGMNEIKKAVRFLVDDGVDFIKVMVTGGGSTPQTNKEDINFTDKELHSISKEAHNKGMRVAAHAHGTRGIIQALKAGVDTIEHCSFLRNGEMNVEFDILKIIKDKGITIIPTLSTGIRTAYEGPFILKSFKRLVNSPLGSNFYKKICLFKELCQNRISIAAGNDAGVKGTPHNDFVTELELMLESGMEMMEVIKSATSKAAKTLGLDNEIGTIEVGKKADLIVIDEDLFKKKNLCALRNPYIVIYGGRKVVF